MIADLKLSSLATSFGKVHGAIVEGAIRGSKLTGPYEPPTKRALARLKEITEMPQKDYEKLTQIVDLALGMQAPGNKQTLLRLKQIDEELRAKPDETHPLLLAFSSIANDSATTALKELSSTGDGANVRKREKHDVVTTAVGADILGAVIGGIAGGKAGGDLTSVLVGAVGGAIFASSEVGAGRPFPVIVVIVE